MAPKVRSIAQNATIENNDTSSHTWALPKFQQGGQKNSFREGDYKKRPREGDYFQNLGYG